MFIGISIFVYHVMRHICDVEKNATPVIMSLVWMILPFIPASNVFFIVGEYVVLLFYFRKVHLAN
jgi:hypothetical protein